MLASNAKAPGPAATTSRVDPISPLRRARRSRLLDMPATVATAEVSRRDATTRSYCAARSQREPLSDRSRLNNRFHA